VIQRGVIFCSRFRLARKQVGTWRGSRVLGRTGADPPPEVRHAPGTHVPSLGSVVWLLPANQPHRPSLASKRSSWPLVQQHFSSAKDRDHRPYLYLAQPMFGLKPSVSARTLSWRFLLLFVELWARDNSEKQEASAVLFPSWSPAMRGKTNNNNKKKSRAVPLFRTSRNSSVECRATACIGQTLGMSPGSQRPPRCLCHRSSTAHVPQPGLCILSASRAKHPMAWHGAVWLPDASASSSGKINVFS